MKSMQSLEPGQSGTVGELLLSGERAASLTRLGLLPGTRVCCLRRSPLGDPTAYLLRGTVLALRSRDASRILLQPELEGTLCIEPTQSALPETRTWENPPSSTP